MKSTVFAFAFVMITICTSAQNFGVGVRLGEPLGLTVKKYLPDNKAIEFVVGSAGKGWDKRYYKASFDHINDFDGYVYQDHSVKNVFFLQGRMVFHKDIYAPELDGKIQWYWGIGGTFKTAKVEYEYRHPDPPYTHFFKKHTDIDFGPDGIIGMEYTFKDLPVSLFAEFNLYLELVDRTKLRMLGGTGARINF